MFNEDAECRDIVALSAVELLNHPMNQLIVF